MIDKNSSVPLYSQVKEKIYNNIINGFWKVDEQIPTEKELMEIYQVGRATIREAILQLTREGYIYKRRGIGTFVGKSKSVFGIEPLISLEYSLKCQGINAVNSIESNEVVRLTDKLREETRFIGDDNCLYIRRLRYADGEAIAIENTYFNKKYHEELSKYDLNKSIAKILLHDMKLDIVSIDQKVILRKPTDPEADILNLNKETLVIEMKRWLYVKNDDNPFQFLMFIISSDAIATTV